MKDTVLYLDKLSPQLEQILIDMCPEDVDLKFLQPNAGKKGELSEATIFFDTTYKVTKEIIDAAPNLRLIQRTGVGVDMIDMDYAREKGIPVSISVGCNSISVAELAVSLMLALYRHIPQLDVTTKQGKWQTWLHRHSSFEILGKTVGVLGAGAIGREVCKRVIAFGANVKYYDVNRLSEDVEKELGVTYADFDEVIKTADIITVHLPLFPGTRGLIGEKEFKAMKKNAILVNTARGPVVDQKALYDALLNGEIAGAGSDVFESMPADKNDLLFTLPDDINFIALPHIGAATYDTYYRVFKLCLNNVERLAQGEEALHLL